MTLYLLHQSRTCCLVDVLKVFFGSLSYYIHPPWGRKNIQVVVSPEGKPISHAFPFWSKTVNDRVEILAEGFPRVVIGELRGRRGGSILACGCTHVNICVQNKFYCWHPAHPMADANGQKLVLELASPQSRTEEVGGWRAEGGGE